jgi:hypothetical protein
MQLKDGQKFDGGAVMKPPMRPLIIDRAARSLVDSSARLRRRHYIS